jgi:hypothetical protein
VKLTFGNLTVLPPAVVSEPVWVTESSHSVGLVWSAGCGRLRASDQESAGAYAVPFHCWVVMDASRTVDQNVGPLTWQLPPAAQ